MFVGGKIGRKVKQGVIFCPAASFYLTIYLNHFLIVSGTKVSIIMTFYGIRWGLHVMEINSPTDNPFVPLAFEECQRLCETETTKKELVTSDIVKALITKYGGKNYNISDLKFLLTILLGFAGLLCMEELLDIKLKHKNTRESLISLNPKIKADQNREGHVVYISRTKSECCPVKYLEVYLQKAKLEISNNNKSPLIYRIFKTKCVW